MAEKKGPARKRVSCYVLPDLAANYLCRLRRTTQSVKRQIRARLSADDSGMAAMLCTPPSEMRAIWRAQGGPFPLLSARPRSLSLSAGTVCPGPYSNSSDAMSAELRSRRSIPLPSDDASTDRLPVLSTSSATYKSYRRPDQVRFRCSDRTS